MICERNFELNKVLRLMTGFNTQCLVAAPAGQTRQADPLSGCVTRGSRSGAMTALRSASSPPMAHDSDYMYDVVSRMSPRQRVLSGAVHRAAPPPDPRTRVSHLLRQRSLSDGGSRRPGGDRTSSRTSSRTVTEVAALDTDLTRARKTVWVAGIPSLCATSNAVTLAMGKLGEVFSTHMRVKEGQNKTWALVMYKTAEAAGRACSTAARLRSGAFVTKDWSCERVTPEKLKCLEAQFVSHDLRSVHQLACVLTLPFYLRNEQTTGMQLLDAAGWEKSTTCIEPEVADSSEPQLATRSLNTLRAATKFAKFRAEPAKTTAKADGYTAEISLEDKLAAVTADHEHISASPRAERQHQARGNMAATFAQVRPHH